MTLLCDVHFRQVDQGHFPSSDEMDLNVIIYCKKS